MLPSYNVEALILVHHVAESFEEVPMVEPIVIICVVTTCSIHLIVGKGHSTAIFNSDHGEGIAITDSSY